MHLTTVEGRPGRSLPVSPTIRLLGDSGGRFERARGSLRRRKLGEVVTHLAFPTVHPGPASMLLPLRRERDVLMLLLLPIDGLGRHEQRWLSLTLLFPDVFLLLILIILLVQLVGRGRRHFYLEQLLRVAFGRSVRSRTRHNLLLLLRVKLAKHALLLHEGGLLLLLL